MPVKEEKSHSSQLLYKAVLYKENTENKSNAPHSGGNTLSF